MSEAQTRLSVGRGSRKSSARGGAPHADSGHEVVTIGAAEGALSILTQISSDRLKQLSKRQLIRGEWIQGEFSGVRVVVRIMCLGQHEKVIEDLFAMLAKTENEREKRFAVVLRTMLAKQEERKRTAKVQAS
eukprot:1192860-Prorocentrum_minimum.AAC.3